MTSTTFKLLPHQELALKKLHSGAILAGKVGSGKTFTSLAFYKENYIDLPLIVITTAKNRDSHNWEKEAEIIGLKKPTVDSWNNIKKYANQHAFFIFDEQHASGSGKWAKTFISIAKKNKWIILSATPGDKWIDFATVFIANGLVKNITEFNQTYVNYNRYVDFPQIIGYRNVHDLEAMRHAVVVTMPDKRKTVRRKHIIKTEYDRFLYDRVVKTRFNPFTNMPIKNKSEYTQVLRKIVATSPARILEFYDRMTTMDRVIVFYNYNYELDIILQELDEMGYPGQIAIYNGKRHDPTPIEHDGKWVYIVQYNAAEAWNNVATDTMLFYSPNYSYKVMEQCEGRIDRINTSFTDLHYYTLLSDSPVDKAVQLAIKEKRIFNEGMW